MLWRQYEEQIYREFSNKYPDREILFDEEVLGRHSKVLRQVDILIRYSIAEVDCIAAFDCKCYAQRVDVQTVDYMVGYIDDLGASFGGVVTTIGFSEGAKSRAIASKVDLRTIVFESVEQVIDQFIPRLDFSDPRNSMYIPLLF